MPGERVGEAVAVVQCCRMSALAKAREGISGKLGERKVDGSHAYPVPGNPGIKVNSS